MESKLSPSFSINEPIEEITEFAFCSKELGSFLFPIKGLDAVFAAVAAGVGGVVSAFLASCPFCSVFLAASVPLSFACVPPLTSLEEDVLLVSLLPDLLLLLSVAFAAGVSLDLPSADVVVFPSALLPSVVLEASADDCELSVVEDVASFGVASGAADPIRD